jgi:hypothetical protein
MTLAQRCQLIFQAAYQFGQNSFRSLAAEINLSKSSVHRLYHRIASRNRFPESSLWETEAGQQWLRYLVFATIFVFALQGGIGCERLSQFFRLLRLERHIGVSPTALRSLRGRMESLIIDYQQQQQGQIQDNCADIEICAAADETFFDQVILVLLDLSSGYIFLEEKTSDCQYETWQQQVQKAFQQLGIKVKYLVSDRAKAIIKLALNDLGASSVSDLFHVLLDLNRSLGFELNCLSSRLHKQIKLGQVKQVAQQVIDELSVQRETLQKSILTYEHCCYQLTTCLHPFTLKNSLSQTTTDVKLQLQEILLTLQQLQRTHKLQDSRNSIRKLANQLDSLSIIVDIWWSWVDLSLTETDHTCERIDWVKHQLLATAYWYQQSQRADNSQLRQKYEQAYHQARQTWLVHPLTLNLSQKSQNDWWNWALWMVNKFQRCSSPIEGRNGYLAQIHHNRRGLSSQRLKVATVIHNYVIRRSDGTTAAERLFGLKFPDLFEFLVHHLGELPQPRRARKSSIAQTFTLSTVPS